MYRYLVGTYYLPLTKVQVVDKGRHVCRSAGVCARMYVRHGVRLTPVLHTYQCYIMMYSVHVYCALCRTTHSPTRY